MDFFLLPNSIPLCGYTVFYLSIHLHFGCFKPVAIRKTPAVNIRVYFSTWIPSYNDVNLIIVYYLLTCFVVVVQSLSHVQLFVTPWTAAHQASLSITVSLNLLTLVSIELLMPSNHLLLYCPLLLLPSVFSTIKVFLKGSALHVMCPKYWRFSFSISSTNEYWFPLWLTILISLLSKWLSRVFSSTTVQRHQFFGIQPLYGTNLRSVHEYWTNHTFDYMDFCQKSDVSAF